MPIKYIISGLVLIGLIAGIYFAVQSYNSTMKENEQLKIENKSVKDERDQIKNDYENIVTLVDKNATMEKQVVKQSETIIKEIHSAPVTTQCVESPAISIAIEKLKTK